MFGTESGKLIWKICFVLELDGRRIFAVIKSEQLAGPIVPNLLAVEDLALDPRDHGIASGMAARGRARPGKADASGLPRTTSSRAAMHEG